MDRCSQMLWSLNTTESKLLHLVNKFECFRCDKRSICKVTLSTLFTILMARFCIKEMFCHLSKSVVSARRPHSWRLLGAGLEKIYAAGLKGQTQYLLFAFVYFYLSRWPGIEIHFPRPELQSWQTQLFQTVQFNKRDIISYLNPNVHWLVCTNRMWS